MRERHARPAPARGIGTPPPRLPPAARSRPGKLRRPKAAPGGSLVSIPPASAHRGFDTCRTRCGRVTVEPHPGEARRSGMPRALLAGARSRRFPATFSSRVRSRRPVRTSSFRAAMNRSRFQARFRIRKAAARLHCDKRVGRRRHSIPDASTLDLPSRREASVRPRRGGVSPPAAGTAAARPYRMRRFCRSRPCSAVSMRPQQCSRCNEGTHESHRIRRFRRVALPPSLVEGGS
jgi:hypothetical protein